MVVKFDHFGPVSSKVFIGRKSESARSLDEKPCDLEQLEPTCHWHRLVLTFSLIVKEERNNLQLNA